MSDGVELDNAGAIAAIDAIAAKIGRTRQATAEAIIAIADASMARALRRVSVERGIDPRQCALIAFGGGGPLHACGLADRLDIGRVIVTPHAGVLSALGLAIAPNRRTAAASVMRRVETLSQADVSGLATGLASRVTGMHSNGRNGLSLRWASRARYVGQGHELDVPFLQDATPAWIGECFATHHQERYGFTLDRSVEIVSARCTASTAERSVRLARRGKSVWTTERRDDGAELDAVLRGPATVELPDATLLVAAGWEARALPIGGWVLERRP
jgi:N-methylhydantoinase A